jgi:hypothetical protein
MAQHGRRPARTCCAVEGGWPVHRSAARQGVGAQGRCSTGPVHRGAARQGGEGPMHVALLGREEGPARVALLGRAEA